MCRIPIARVLSIFIPLVVFLFAQPHIVVAVSSDDIDVVIATLERQENDLGAIEINYIHEVGLSSGSASASIAMQTRLKQRECIDGPLKSLQTTGNMDVRLPDNKYEQTTVRSSARQKRFRALEKRGEIHGQVYFPTDYIAVTYGLSEGFIARLKKEKHLIESSKKRVNGREIVQLTWTDELNTDVTCLLDPARFYQPLEIISDTPSRGDYPDGRDRTFCRTEVLDFWESDSAALPSRVRQTVESVWDDGKRLLICEIRLVVTEIKRNVRFDPSEFDIDFPKGTLVTDAEQMIYYHEGDPDSIKTFSYSAPAITPNAVGSQVVKSLRSNYWLYLSIGSLLAIASGLFQKWRKAD